MVVKAATKKWLMDNGLDEHTAHLWADGKRREELVKMNFKKTMNHLYLNAYLRVSLLVGEKMSKETFFREGPPKDMGFYPFTMTFTDMIGKDIRYDDYIYQYIRGVKRNSQKEGGLRFTLPTSEYLNMITEWGKRDKPQMTFMNYNTLPFNEKS